MPTASRHVDNDLEADGVDEDGEISDELRYGKDIMIPLWDSDLISLLHKATCWSSVPFC